jgi:Holliday junction resolvase
MVNSKKKGSRVELEMVHFLKENGIEARRTAQYCGNSGDASDIVVEDKHPLANWHIEVKGTAKSAVVYGMYVKWLKQASNDSNGKPWVILHKANNRPIGAISMAILPSYYDVKPAAKLLDFPQELIYRKEKKFILDRIHGGGIKPYYPSYAILVDNVVLSYSLAVDFLSVLKK